MKRILLVIPVVVVLGAVSAIAWTTWSARGEREIIEVADQLQVPADWVLERENVEPQRLFCLGGNRCPSLSRKWLVPGELSAAELQQVLIRSGWNLTPEQSCSLLSATEGTSSCVLSGPVDDYAVQLYHMPPSSAEMTDSARVRLFINP